VIGVLLVDDDQLIRAGIRLILEAEDDIEVVGEASTGREAIEQARRLRPTVVLMDVEMPEMDGIAATREITRMSERIQVVMLTTFQSDEYLFESLRAGASGFSLKRSAPEELLNTLRVVAGGEALLAPSVTVRLIDEFTRTSHLRSSEDGRLDLLTEREVEVLTLVGQGLNNGEIAETMHVSESTAKTHLKRILMKLGLRDRVAAVVFAHECGMLDQRT
jgi:DNA-binding NarL/FixJ family response regulator